MTESGPAWDDVCKGVHALKDVLPTTTMQHPAVSALDAALAAHDEQLRAFQGAMLRQQAAFRIQSLAEPKPSAGAMTTPAASPQANDTLTSDFGSSIGWSGDYYGLTPPRFYATANACQPIVLQRRAFETKSRSLREVFALSATRLSLGEEELYAHLRAWQAGLVPLARLAPVAKRWCPKNLTALATLLLHGEGDEHDRQMGLTVLELQRAVSRLTSLPWEFPYLYLEALEDQDLSALVENLASREVEVDDTQRALLSANVARRNGAARGQWLSILNEVYADFAMAPIDAGEESGDPLGQLRVTAPDVHSEVKVSVIMPCHRPNPDTFRVAVESVCAQTWRNLEIFVMDDASPAADFDLLRECLPDDPRITLMRMDTNGGTYRNRNIALQQLTGDLVTVHDDDDWSHPQKIQRQAEHLIAHPDVPGNMSAMVRIDEDGFFLRINDNPRWSQPNYSSSMFRTELVRTLGGWDETTKAADAEFVERIALVHGPVERLQEPPTSFMRARAGSLTAGEFQRGYVHPTRILYSLSFGHWHARIKSGDASPSLDHANPEFVRPVGMNARTRGGNTEHVNVLYVSDLTFPGGNSSLLAKEVMAAGSAFSVGVSHLPTPVLRQRRPMNDKVMGALRATDAKLVSLTDQFTADVVVVRNPTVAQFADGVRSRVQAKSVVLIVNSPPLLRGGGEAAYDLGVCLGNLEAMFQAPVTIIPESRQTEQLCRALFPGVAVSDTLWPGFLPDSEIRADVRTTTPGRLPIVGRHSRDQRSKWPDTAAEFTAAYAQPDAYLTRILGGVDSINTLLDARTKADLTVLPFGDEGAVGTFLEGLDFWVYLHSIQLTESFGMGVLESMAHGLPVILPTYMEPMFGPGARYVSTAAEVRPLVEALWADPTAYSQLSQQALDTARSRYSGSSYVARLQHLIEHHAPAEWTW